MKERSPSQSGDPSRKDKGKVRKSRAAMKLFASSNWPKVMISRADRVSERTEVFTEITPSSSRQQAHDDEEEDEESDRDVKHLYCGAKEEQGICLITSSSEIEENPGIKEATGAKENGLKTFDKLVKEKENDRSVAETMITKFSNEEKSIVVDLTTDEKNVWKQTIVKRFSDAKSLVMINEEERGTKNGTTSIAISN